MIRLTLSTGIAALLFFSPAVVAQAGAASKPAVQAGKKAPIPTKKLRVMPLSKQKAKTPEDLTKLYEEALAEAFVEKGGWMIDYDAARAKAKKEGKIIFAYFTRSYAY